MPHRRPALLAAACLALLPLVGSAAARSQDAPAPLVDVCAVRTSERLVAVGDVHGAYDRFVGILRAAGILDNRARWAGGRAVLVQTGDLVDRGADSRKVLDLMMRLEREAARAGGAVYALVGNHEVMRMHGQWQDVSAGEFAAFRTPESSELREAVHGKLAEDAARQARAEKRPFDARGFRAQFMREVPLGFLEMRQAFSPAGEYGAWLRARPAVAIINDVLFVHGGIDSVSAALGCAAINAEVKRELASGNRPSADDLPVWLTTRETGPLWYRGLALAPEAAAAAEVTATLATLGVRAIVAGHTPMNGSRITTRFDGRVVFLDTGMLGGDRYPGGAASALEIAGGTMSAIYADRKEPLR